MGFGSPNKHKSKYKSKHKSLHLHPHHVAHDQEFRRNERFRETITAMAICGMILADNVLRLDEVMNCADGEFLRSLKAFQILRISLVHGSERLRVIDLAHKLKRSSCAANYEIQKRKHRDSVVLDGSTKSDRLGLRCRTSCPY